MTTDELKKFESLHSDFNKYWMPLTWFSNLASRAREEGRVRDDIALRLLMDVRVLFFYYLINTATTIHSSAVLNKFNPDIHVYFTGT